MKKKTASSLVFAVFAMGAVSNANALIIGSPDSPNFNNCYPFGCDESNWGATYQQVYASSAFAGPIVISALSFYQWNNYTTPASGTYTIELSTTSADVDALSGTPGDNYGVDNTLVFTGSLPSSIPLGGQMDILLDSTFAYDPSQGNLLLSVRAPTNVAGSLYLAADNYSNDAMSRQYMGNTDTAGLVTGFNEAGGAIPEPATLALMGLGLAGIGFSRKKKRAL